MRLSRIPASFSGQIRRKLSSVTVVPFALDKQTHFRDRNVQVAKHLPFSCHLYLIRYTHP